MLRVRVTVGNKIRHKRSLDQDPGLAGVTGKGLSKSLMNETSEAMVRKTIYYWARFELPGTTDFSRTRLKVCHPFQVVT